MNQVVLMLYLSNSLSNLLTPTVPAKRPMLTKYSVDHSRLDCLLGEATANLPREISLVESWPPYEPSQPATASISTDMQHNASARVSH